MSLLDEVREARPRKWSTLPHDLVISVEARDALVELADALTKMQAANFRTMEWHDAYDEVGVALERLRR